MKSLIDNAMDVQLVIRPVERGERGESFPGPRDVRGPLPGPDCPASLKNTE